MSEKRKPFLHGEMPINSENLQDGYMGEPVGNQSDCLWVPGHWGDAMYIPDGGAPDMAMSMYVQESGYAEEVLRMLTEGPTNEIQGE